MTYLNVELDRTAHYITYQGQVEAVPFKALKKFWSRESFCVDCTKKLKTNKKLLTQEYCLSENDICMNCLSLVSF